MNTITNFEIDQDLSVLLNENFNTEDKKLFLESFKIYLQYGNDDTKFVINIDDIWKWIGYTEKSKLKKLLLNHFSEYNHYIIALAHSGKRKNEGGHNKEIIIMNVNTFKKLCMKASTSRSNEICDYYIKMENIMHQYTMNKLNQNTIDLKNAKLIIHAIVVKCVLGIMKKSVKI